MRQIYNHLRAQIIFYYEQNWGLCLVCLATLVRLLSLWGSKRAKYHPLPMPHFITTWKENFLTLVAPHDSLGLLRGMFLGDASQIPQTVKDTFYTGGLMHLLAASGFNCWIVSFAFLLGIRLIIPSAKPWRRHLERGCQVGGAWLFWCWSDQAPPVTRAALLVTAQQALNTMGIAVAFGRLLFVQYILSMFFAPELFLNCSFQLSFGCLFGMVIMQKLPLPMPAYLSASLGACLGVMPVTWIFFGEIHFTSILTNWLAVPPVSFLFMPWGLITILLSPLPGLKIFLEAITTVCGHLCILYFKILSFWIAHIPHLAYTPFRD